MSLMLEIALAAPVIRTFLQPGGGGAPGSANVLRLLGWTDDAPHRRCFVRFEVGARSGAVFVAATPDEGAVFNGDGYTQAGWRVGTPPVETTVLAAIQANIPWTAGVVRSR